jgi:hypothetical protein
MAAFTTMEQAEARGKAMTANNTWYEAHSARDKDGVIIVRFRRFITNAFSLTQAAWLETSDDTVT